MKSNVVSQKNSNSLKLSNGKVTFDLKVLSKGFSKDIIDVKGRPVYSKSEAAGVLHVENLPKGIYFIHISSEEQSMTRKLIVH